MAVACTSHVPSRIEATTRPGSYSYGSAQLLRSPSPPPLVPVASPGVVRASPSPASDLLAEINSDRRSQGLSPLAFNSCLAAVAGENAKRMATAGAGSPWNGSDRDAACGLNDPQTGEVAGYWTGGVDARAINGLFLKDAADRQTIYFQYYCCAGFAWAVAANGYGYASIEFG